MCQGYKSKPRGNRSQTGTQTVSQSNHFLALPPCCPSFRCLSLLLLVQHCQVCTDFCSDKLVKFLICLSLPCNNIDLEPNLCPRHNLTELLFCSLFLHQFSFSGAWSSWQIPLLSSNQSPPGTQGWSERTFYAVGTTMFPPPSGFLPSPVRETPKLNPQSLKAHCFSANGIFKDPPSLCYVLLLTSFFFF